MKPASNMKQCRMTMVELLIAMSILVIIMGFLGNVIWDVRTLTERKQMQSDVYEQQRLFFDILTQDIRAIYASDMVYCQFDNYTADTGVSPREGAPTADGYRARFVSASGIGTKVDSAAPGDVTKSDLSPLVEVGYNYDQATQTIQRGISTQRDGVSWDFRSPPSQLVTVDDSAYNWFPDSSAPPHVSDVAISVSEFAMVAYDSEGSVFPPAPYTNTTYNGSSPTPPAYIEARITLGSPELTSGDPGYQAAMQTFTKKIYINREY